MIVQNAHFIYIKNLPFFKDIIREGGEVFFVGGCVRDHLLQIEPKDIDMVVRLLPIQQLINILNRHGKVDLVGESFGVIKFKEFDGNEEFELSLPRVDSLDKTQKGHRAILSQCNPMLSIEEDLRRRDFTCNSIAISQGLEIIDPFGGDMDIHHDIIRATDKTAFVEDPLRMIRAIQFASRFQFTIEPDTLELIKSNAFRIKEISPERILMEFQKVVDKHGDPFIFMDLMHETRLWNLIFDFTMKKMGGVNPRTISELLFFTVRGENPPISDWGNFFENKLKIDIKTKKEFRAFEIVNDAWNNNNTIFENRKSFFRALQICPWAMDLQYFELNGIDKNDFLNGRFPKSFKDLDITGEEFISLGLEGKAIGEMQRKLVELIMDNKLVNANNKIKKYINGAK